MRLQSPAWLVGGLPLLLIAAGALAQGTFQNLDFEAANVSGYPPISNVPIASALPGWSGYFTSSTYTNATTQVWYDGISLGGAAISIADLNAPSLHPIQGAYSALLFGGGGFGIGAGLTSATISQTGLVPVGTRSLLFDAVVYNAPFVVTLGGQTIDMIALQTFSSYTLYGGNIPSALAGQSETLSFTEPPGIPISNQPSVLQLDNIQFSDQSVPEPGIFALSGLGALLVGWRVLARRR